MRDFEHVKVSFGVAGEPLGEGMLRVAYDIGYDYFRRVYQHEVHEAECCSPCTFLAEFGPIVKDPERVWHEAVGISYPKLMHSSTEELIKQLRNGQAGCRDRVIDLVDDCEGAMKKGLVDGLKDLLDSVMKEITPVGSYCLSYTASIVIYEIDDGSQQVAARLELMGVDDNHCYPKWCEIFSEMDEEGDLRHGFYYDNLLIWMDEVMKL